MAERYPARTSGASKCSFRRRMCQTLSPHRLRSTADANHAVRKIGTTRPSALGHTPAELYRAGHPHFPFLGGFVDNAGSLEKTLREFAVCRRILAALTAQAELVFLGDHR